MGARNKKKLKRVNLLEMPNHERNQLTKEVREKLQQKITEAKLWRSLLEVESLTINGNIVYKGDEPLSGFLIRR
jgi:hypothetical protein